jgi:phage terminase small subunit
VADQKKLTPKQARFVAEYLKDSNATQAAIRCGYSEKTAGQIGHALLKKVEVAAAVEARLEKHAENAGISTEWVLAGIKRHAEQAEAEMVSLKAYELAGKHLKLFTDKIEATGEGGGPVVVEIRKFTLGGK